jgi:hypothetical protein
MNIEILSNPKRRSFASLAFLIIALLASCVTPSITRPTITVTSIPSTHTPLPTESSPLPPLSPEIIELLHNGGTYDRSQNGFVDKYDQLKFELSAGQWKPVAVPTKQIIQYPWCKRIEDFQKCVIPQSAIFDGSYADFVQSTLTQDLFDTTKLKFFPLSVLKEPNGDFIYYGIDDLPHFPDTAMAPFKKSYAFGVTNLYGKEQFVIAVPYYIEGVAPKNWPIITGLYEHGKINQNELDTIFYAWNNKMNIPLWNASDLRLAASTINPVTGKKFTLAEAKQIVDEILQGNFTHTHRLVLRFAIYKDPGYPPKSWFE